MDSLALIITIALICVGRKIYIEAKVNSYDLDKVSIGKWLWMLVKAHHR